MDLPLTMHPHAFRAAEAAQCAGEQGEFWAFHDQLFVHYRSFTPEDFPSFAEIVGLDPEAFESCLGKGRAAAGIREDLRVAGSFGITGTPAFLLGRRIAGSDKAEVVEVIRGAQPYELFEEKIEALLGGE